MHSIPFNCSYMFVQAATDLFKELSVLSVFLLCICVCILVAHMLCRSILFDNYSMYKLSSHTTGPYT